MKEVHCTGCGRFLCKLAFGDVEIKCPKCKLLNKIVINTFKQLLTATPDEDTIKT